MVNKTISISYQLSLLLSKEENASALISNLLNNYYQTETKKEKRPDDVVEEIQELQKVIEEKEKEFVVLSEKHIEVEKTEAEKEAWRVKNEELNRKIKEDFYRDNPDLVEENNGN